MANGAPAFLSTRFLVPRPSGRTDARSNVRRELDGIDAVAGPVVERDGQRRGLAVDPGHAEELVPLGGGAVRLQAVGDALELDARAEGVVEPGRAERAGVQGAADELPE